MADEYENTLKELMRIKRKPTNKTSQILLVAGMMIITLSVDYSNSVALLVGITLIFFGAIFRYARPNKFIRQDILIFSLSKEYTDYIRLIKEIGFKETPFFFSPKTMWGLNNVIMTISNEKDILIKEDTYIETEEIIINKEYIQLAPPGLGLVKLFEKELKINFSSNNLLDLPNILDRILVDGLEIAKKVNVLFEDEIKVELKNTIFDDLIDEIINRGYIQYGDPLINSIACILAKITGKKIFIKKINKMDNDQTIIYFEIKE